MRCMRWQFLKISILIGLLTMALGAGAKEYAGNIFFGPDATLVKWAYTEFADEVAKVTDGEIQFKIYTSGSLLPPRASMQGIRDNVAQVGYHAGTYTPTELPLNNLIAELSFFYTDWLTTALASTEMSFEVPELEAEWRRNGVVYGGGYSTPAYVLMCNKPIKTLEDLQGKRVRMPGGPWDRWARELGAVSVNVPSTEIYLGLDRGTLDCGANPAEALQTFSFWDVSGYVLDLPLGVYYAGFHWAYNPEFWRSLSLNQRQEIYDRMAWAIARTGINAMRRNNEIILKAKKKGIQFHKPAADLEQAHLEFVQRDRERLIEIGKKIYGIQEPSIFIEKYLTLAKKWHKLLSEVNRDDVQQVYELIKREIYDGVDVARYGL